VRAPCLAAAVLWSVPAAGGEPASAPSLLASAERLVATRPLTAEAFEAEPASSTWCGDRCSGPTREAPCEAGRVNAALATTLATFGGVAAGAWSAGGAPADPERTRNVEDFDGVDVALTAASLAWLAHDRVRALTRDDHTPARSLWPDCDARGSDALNGLDARARRDWRWSNRAAAARASDALLVASLVAPIGHLARRDAWRDGRYLFEAAAVSAALNTVVKRAFHRPRPYTHFCDVPCGERLEAEDAHLSFYSGHATMAFTAAAATGALAGVRGEPHVGRTWATGLALAAATSYFRVAADRHYLSDVLVGAAVGSAVGWGVVRLHRGAPVPRPSPAAPAPRASGAAAALSAPLGASGWLRAGPTPGGFAASASWTW
jgi:membrane-associated phospholipid phosphatase